MEGSSKKFQTFEDLEVYREARAFRKEMYAAARKFPEFEKFGLTSQVRRAAVSLTNNIAEGHGRFHYPDQVKFGLQARGSLEELIDDLNVCADENYLAPTEIENLKHQGWRVLRVLNGYLRFLRNQHLDKTKSTLREISPSYTTEAPAPFEIEEMGRCAIM